MFIKLRAERFWGRLTVQERGAGLGDIFTQNTLTAIRVMCQVLDLTLYGHMRRSGGGLFLMETTTSAKVQQLGGHSRSNTRTHICIQSLKQRFLLSCLRCIANTTHIITQHRWPLTPVSLPSWFPHIQVSAVTHDHSGQGQPEAGCMHTHAHKH